MLLTWLFSICYYTPNSIWIFQHEVISSPELSDDMTCDIWIKLHSSIPGFIYLLSGCVKILPYFPFPALWPWRRGLVIAQAQRWSMPKTWVGRNKQKISSRSHWHFLWCIKVVRLRCFYIFCSNKLRLFTVLFNSRQTDRRGFLCLQTITPV